MLHAYRRDRSGKRPAKGSPEELSWCVLKGNEADMRIRKRAGAKQRAIKQPIGNEALPMRLSFGHRSGLASGAETTVQLFPCHRSSRINFDSLVNLHWRLPILVHLNISTSFLAGPYVSQYHSPLHSFAGGQCATTSTSATFGREFPYRMSAHDLLSIRIGKNPSLQSAIIYIRT